MTGIGGDPRPLERPEVPRGVSPDVPSDAPRPGAPRPGDARVADAALVREWFRAVYEQSDFPVCFGEGPWFTAANDAFLALIGWTREAFEAQPILWADVTDGAESSGDAAALAEMLATGRWTPYEKVYRRPDGTTVPVLLGGAMLSTDPYRWVVYAVDIRRQREVEQALARSEERLALAVKGSNDGIWDWDFASGQLYVSPRVAAFLGYSSEAHLLSRSEVFAVVHPADRDMLEDRLTRHFRGEGPFRVETRVQRANGEWHWLRLRGEVARNAAGEPVRMAGTITDIQDRRAAEEALRQSEERYALATRATLDGIWSLDVGSREAWVSARLAQMFGFGEFPEGGMMPLERLHAMLDEESMAAVRRAWHDCLSSGATYDLVVCVRTGQPPTPRWFRNRAFAARDEAGRPVRVVGNTSEVTAEVEAREQLRLSEARLRQSQKMDALGTLAGGIAHDFNNLLSVILGYADVGERSAAPETVTARALREIAVAGRRARALVQQILAFSRRGDDLPLREPVELGPVLRETLAMLRSTLPAVVRFEWHIAEDVQGVDGDGTEVQQVLLNLANNAAHAVRAQGGGRLLIEASSIALERTTTVGAVDLTPGRYVSLVVEDSGTGIPAEVVDRMFEPFFTTKPHGEGTGLGLAVVHGIIARMNGAIEVDTQLGVGTRMTVYLPQVPVAPVAPPASATPITRGRVLVVDDDAAVAAVLCDQLGQLGYDATVARTGEEALAAVSAGSDRFSVVITDQRMPGMSGDVLTALVRERHPRLPVVLCTAFSQTLTEDRARAVGAQAFLHKPIPLERLLETLQRVAPDQHAPLPS